MNPIFWDFDSEFMLAAVLTLKQGVKPTGIHGDRLPRGARISCLAASADRLSKPGQTGIGFGPRDEKASAASRTCRGLI
jgi:hypothetical protein